MAPKAKKEPRIQIAPLEPSTNSMSTVILTLHDARTKGCHYDISGRHRTNSAHDPTQP